MPDIELNPPALRVLIVDRHEVSRAAIRALLRTEGLVVVADVASAAEGLALADEAKPDIAIVDVDLGSAVALALASGGALTGLAARVVLTASTPLQATPNGYTFIPKSEICARLLRHELTAQHTDTKEPPNPLMTMQAYLDTITTNTGKTPEEITDLARAEGLLEPGVRPQAIISWLKDEFGLGRGHAMAIVSVIRRQTEPQASTDVKVDRHFAGRKAVWRPVYDNLASAVAGFGPDIDVDAGKAI
jgi:CheY-like chemotaxis protein